MTSFYRSFEDKFRGPREVIKARQEVYLPFVLPLLELYRDCRVIDLGCGRGEWLEILSEYGFSAIGIDLEEGMLAACRDLNLCVYHAEALAYLKSVPDESQVVVSAFHLVEHISFDDMRSLINEALRVLKPAGILILETPNSENLVVGTSSFYLDPTHRCPIPAELLKFLSNICGYKRSKILYLNEDSVMQNSQNMSLYTVLAGVSPDYALVAQKNADLEVMESFDAPFLLDLGSNLRLLALKYDEQFQAQFSKTLDLATESLVRLEKVESDIHRIVNSSSWRITRPLRLLVRFFRDLFDRQG